MEWVPKKLIEKQLQKYFYLEDANHIQVSLYSKRQIRLKNLILKTQAINSDTMIVHIRSCRIDSLEIIFDSSNKQGPLQIKIDKIALIVKFNDKRKQNNEAAVKKMEEIKRFNQSVASQQPYKERNWLQQEFYYLFKILSQFFIGKLHLQITNVDLALEYQLNKSPKYFGVEVKNVILNKNMSAQSQIDLKNQNEDLCVNVFDASVYFGIPKQKDIIIENKCYNRDVSKKTPDIKKKYIIKDHNLKIYYNMKNSQITVAINSIQAIGTKLCLREILNILNLILPYFWPKPYLRPGEGKPLNIPKLKHQAKQLYGIQDKYVEKAFQMKEGTYLWWHYATNKILNKINTGSSKNILTQLKYRKYLYALLYRYTYGCQKDLEKYIENYQFFQDNQTIFKTHCTILEKIHTIQTEKYSTQLHGFVAFLNNTRKKPHFKELKLKQITYHDIKKAYVFINYENAVNFTNKYVQQTQRGIYLTIKIKSINILISENQGFRDLWNDMHRFQINDFKKNKNVLADAYFAEQIHEYKYKSKGKQIQDFSINIKNLFFEMNQIDQMIFNFDTLLVQDHISVNQILALKGIRYFREKNDIIKQITVRDIINIKIGSIFFNLEKKFIERLLFLMNIIEINNSQAVAQPDVVDQFISQKIPRDRVLESYSTTTTQIIIKQMIFAIPTFDRDNVFGIQLQDFKISAPVDEETFVTLERIDVVRTTYNNILARQDKYRRSNLQELNEWKVLSNNQKLDAKFYKDKGIFLFNIAIPFILVQICFQDLYFIFNIMNEWMSLFQNPFLFTQTKKKQEIKVSRQLIRKANIDFIEALTIKIPKTWEKYITMSGIQFILYAESKKGVQNQVLSILVDQINLKKQYSFTEETYNLKVKDIFVRNCLGDAQIDQLSLQQVMKGNKFPNYPPIIRNSKKQQSLSLILYSDPTKNEKKELQKFINLSYVHRIDMKKQRMIREIKLNIEPLFIFHFPDFFQNLTTIINTASSLAKQNFLNASSKLEIKNIKKPPTDFQYEEKEIIEAKEFGYISLMNISIKKINLLVMEKQNPGICIALVNFALKHKTQFYVSKFYITIDRMDIVDTSFNSGQYPTIAESTTPLEIVFTKYNSRILQERYKKNSLLSIKLKKPRLYFLQRKIMDLVNWLLFTMDSILGNNKDKKQQEVQKPRQLERSSYGFTFSIQIENTQLIIPRNSLSDEQIIGNIQSIFIKNFTSTQKKNLPEDKFMEIDQNEEESDQHSSQFDSCSQLNEEQIQFRSFVRQEQFQNQRLTFYIDLNMIKLYNSSQNNKKSFLDIPSIFIQMTIPKMNLIIKETVNISFKDDDYRLLIRITQQNLSEVPIIFPAKGAPSQNKDITFDLAFGVDQIKLRKEAGPKQQDLIFTFIENLKGTFVLFTNGEKEVNLGIGILSSENVQFITILQKCREKKHIFYTENKLFNTQNNRIIQISENNKKILSNFFKKSQDKRTYLQQQEANDSFSEIDEREKIDTNTERLVQWFKGMCGICYGCCCACCVRCCCKELDPVKKQKKKIEKAKQYASNIYNFVQSKIQGLNNEQKVEQVHQFRSYEKAERIKHFQQILDFKVDQHISQIKNKLNQQSMLFLNMKMYPWGQKSIYILVNNLNIKMHPNKNLLKLISFLSKPYTIVDKPDYYVTNNFNNYRPSKMLIEVKNSQIQLNSNGRDEEKVLISFNLNFDSKNKGDIKNGPGISTMLIDMWMQMWFFGKNMPKIKLSEIIKLTYEKIQKTPFYEQNIHKVIHSQDKITLQPSSQDSFNSQSKIKIFIPIFIMQSLQKILKFMLSGDEPKRKEGQRESHRNQQEMIEKSDTPKKKPDLRFNFSGNRIGLIQQIRIEIMSKINSCLAYLKMDQVQFCGLNMKDRYEESTLNKINSKLYINYLNLKMGQFEPFLEPWTFEIEMKSTKKEELQFSKFMIVSIDNNAGRTNPNVYKNGLNINISSQFFHTYKQLEMKYLQNQYDLQQKCNDLTSLRNANYRELFSKTAPQMMKSRIHSNNFSKDLEQRQSQQEQSHDFPQHLKKFFGREFKIEEKNQKKIPKAYENQKFNFPILRIFLFHSYFDHMRRRKRVTYRTPYRILNLTEKDFDLELMFPKINEKVIQELKSRQYYAMPKDYYDSDILINFSINQKCIQEAQLSSNLFQFLTIQDKTYNKEYTINSSVLSPDHSKDKNSNSNKKKYSSARYLFSDYSKITDFEKNKLMNSKLHEKLFPFSTSQRYIDPNDFSILINQHFFSLICVKNCYEAKAKNNNNSIQKFYDTFLILTYPITIYNQTPTQFKIVINDKLIEHIGERQMLQIKRIPNCKSLQDTKIEFKENILHTQFQFFKQKKKEDCQIMEIDKMQSVMIKSIRETQSTCLVYIYPLVIINNDTQEELQLFYDKKFPIDKKSTACLADINFKNQISLNIFNQEDYSHNINITEIVDLFSLKKLAKDVQEIKQKRIESAQNSRYCCPQKVPNTVYESIDMVIKTLDLAQTITKNIIIKYRYQILNNTAGKIYFFQQNTDFKLFDLNKQDQRYIFHYDFLDKNFIIGIDYQGQIIFSSNFLLDAQQGKSFTLKLRKPFQKQSMQNIYYKKFEYLQLDIQMNQYTSLIVVNNVDLQNFPIYLDNNTDYVLKVTQHDQTFAIKPRKKYIFSWSNLLQNSHQIQVEIQGISKKYSLNQKSEFQPIILKQTKLARGTKIQQPKQFCKKEQCHVTYENIMGHYLVILNLFENILTIHGNENEDVFAEIYMDQGIKMVTSANRIEVYLSENQMFQMLPSSQNMDQWVSMFKYSLNYNIADKIFFVIQAQKNSRIFCFNSFKNGNLKDFRTDTKQVIIPNINISIINSVPEQILLLHAGGIKFQQQNRQRIGSKNYYNLLTTQTTLKVKKIKINNQMLDAVNPVVLTQIKKSHFPFLQLKFTKQFRQKLGAAEITDSQIIHYKSIIFFLDEAEAMIEFSLIEKLMNLKRDFDHLKNQYAVSIHRSQLVSKPEKEEDLKESKSMRQIKSNEVYINYMQIKPIKMTLSISLNYKADQSLLQNNSNYIVSFIRLIPFGVQNAIITIGAFNSFHIFIEEKQMNEILKTFYYSQIKKQIYLNAGSYDILAPIQLVRGLGMGVKNIFYDPFYELVKKKQIKAVTSTCMEGVITLILLIFGFCVKILNIIAKLLALLAFERKFQLGRDMFRKQIFKSPWDGLKQGSKYCWKTFISFFKNLYLWPKIYYQKYSFLGCLFGFLLAVIYVIPFIFKIFVTIYDFIYVIGLGVVNWGYYQQSAMKYRSRPVRSFPSKLITPYNYIDARGYEIIRTNKIQQFDEREDIKFVKQLDENSTKCIILSNYRILYKKNDILSCAEIKLYQIKEIELKVHKKSQKIYMNIHLSIPNKIKTVVWTLSMEKYKIELDDIITAGQFLQQLQNVCRQQRLQIQIKKTESFKHKLQMQGGFWNDIIQNDIKVIGTEKKMIQEQPEQKKEQIKPEMLLFGLK